jgi:hypothetical protein
MKDSNISESEEEAQELSKLARNLGFNKIADKIGGVGSEDDEEEEREFDALSHHRPPSASGYRAVTQTMKWMGARWGDE